MAHFALVSASVPLAFVPTDEEAAAALRAPDLHPRLHGHLLRLLSEVPTAALMEFASEHHLSDDDLLRACETIDRTYGPQTGRLRKVIHGI